MVATWGLPITGCGSDDSGSGAFDGTGGQSTGNDGGFFADGGADAGTSDNEGTAEASLFADPERGNEIFDGGEPNLDASEAYQDEIQACFDADTQCAADGCSDVAACCVGTSLCCLPVASPTFPNGLDLQACEEISVSQCFDAAGATAQTFGSPAGAVGTDGLEFEGSLTTDSGLVMGEAVDLGQKQLRLEATFMYPTGCGVSCVDALGLGVVANSSVLSGTIDADVALLYSGARGQMQLIVAGDAVDAWDSVADSALWALVLNPNGSLQVERNGVELTSREFSMAELRAARLIAYGRSLLASSDRTTLSTITTVIADCDQPDSWGSPSILGFIGGDKPSGETNGTEKRLAFAQDGVIRWAREVGNTFDMVDSAALTPINSYEAGGVTDPELLWDGQMWHLFYTAIDGAGVSSIGHAVASPDALSFSQDVTPTLDARSDWRSFDEPTVYRRDGLWLMIVRGHRFDGSQELVPFYRTTDDGPWRFIEGSSLPTLTRVAAFASEELSDPSLIVHNDTYQLYVARRRGTSWAIELLVSDEMTFFTNLGEVFSGSGVFDNLGASAPDALSSNGEVELYYSGLDGQDSTLARTSRTTP